jgi:hypothetical protein
MKITSSMLQFFVGALLVSLIHCAPAQAAANKRSHLTPIAPSPQTANNIRWLGYGLFLLHIGLKPLQYAKQGDLKLSHRLLKEAAPVMQKQGQN